uniref:Archease domain-containing protein n=1 Tax=Ascaris lumbricoides TaxID=6252 RepID=A0A0M3IKW0_ASCLU
MKHIPNLNEETSVDIAYTATCDWQVEVDAYGDSEEGHAEVFLTMEF